MNNCALCNNVKELKQSHIIPAFVYRWIKETSATGYLRFTENINRRFQDGIKIKLLCQDCEEKFNKYETIFSNKIFYPYVNSELDNYGVAKGEIKSFDYSSWLLKFVISLQWRIIATSKLSSKDLNEKFFKIRNDFMERWRKFLLDEVESTGECESHIYFLQNLIAGEGFLPPAMNDRVNFYLLRATDGTLVSSHKKLGLFSKLGPIAFFTTLKPNRLTESDDTRIRLNGRIKTAQRILNPVIVDFIFITRPNEAMSRMNFSATQNKKIKEAYFNNLDKVEKSMTLNVLESDLYLKKLKKRL